MRAAFAVWNERIAPVFDVAGQVWILDVTGPGSVEQHAEPLPEGAPADRVRRLVELGVGELICGAISRESQAALSGYGIRVVPLTAGPIPEVTRAWLDGRLSAPRFAMPGCGGHRRRRCGQGCRTMRERRGRRCLEETEQDRWEWDR